MIRWFLFVNKECMVECSVSPEGSEGHLVGSIEVEDNEEIENIINILQNTADASTAEIYNRLFPLAHKTHKKNMDSN